MSLSRDDQEIVDRESKEINESMKKLMPTLLSKRGINTITVSTRVHHPVDGHLVDAIRHTKMSANVGFFSASMNVSIKVVDDNGKILERAKVKNF